MLNNHAWKYTFYFLVYDLPLHCLLKNGSIVYLLSPKDFAKECSETNEN